MLRKRRLFFTPSDSAPSAHSALPARPAAQRSFEPTPRIERGATAGSRPAGCL